MSIKLLEGELLICKYVRTYASSRQLLTSVITDPVGASVACMVTRYSLLCVIQCSCRLCVASSPVNHI